MKTYRQYNSDREAKVGSKEALSGELFSPHMSLIVDFKTMRNFL